ncbi:MAG: hypothetical protein MUE69_04830 [Myxococcota bacterium]|jgi:hypothetical protein|nr:hypothetical protein [Myxococcota bacterium]
MHGSKPKRLRFVVGSVLLVGAPLASGCSDEAPMVNTPPPLMTNPIGTESPPTMTEGVGVPLPTPITAAHPPPTPNTVAPHEVTPEPQVDPSQLGVNPSPGALEGLEDTIGEARANPVPPPPPPPPPVIRSNPGPAEREPRE